MSAFELGVAPTTQRPVVVIGAGPIGLATAAHLLKREIPFVLLEAAERISASLRSWKHIAMFSPWSMNIDPVAQSLLEAANWSAPPPEEVPTGGQLLERYLEPLAELPELAAHLRLGWRVTGVARCSVDKLRSQDRGRQPFAVQIARSDGGQSEQLASVVLDTSGTWQHPNWAGCNGLPAIGERQASGSLAYGVVDVLGQQRSRYAGKRVAVVGSGHSAIHSVLDLLKLREQVSGGHISWLMRRDLAQKSQRIAADALPERGAMGQRASQAARSGKVNCLSPFLLQRIVSLAEGGLRLEARAGSVAQRLLVDEVIVATGCRPDWAIARELRLDLDQALECPASLAEAIDPNEHSCGTVPAHGYCELAHRQEPGYFALGSKSYGRAPTFLLATGYEQVRSVVAAVASDWAEASARQVALPLTGACRSSEQGVGCCG